MDLTTIMEKASSVLPDYRPIIRAQIEEAVKELKDKLENKGYSDDYYPTDDVVAEYVKVGYIINAHHGKELFGEGDMIEDIPVRLDRFSPRSIAVCADDVEFQSESEVEEENKIGGTEYRTKVRYFKENLSESTTW